MYYYVELIYKEDHLEIGTTFCLCSFEGVELLTEWLSLDLLRI